MDRWDLGFLTSAAARKEVKWHRTGVLEFLSEAVTTLELTRRPRVASSFLLQYSLLSPTEFSLSPNH